MTTLAEHMIVFGAKNRPLILDKLMYSSWASRIRLYIKGKKYGRMMLDSLDNGPLVYLTIEVDGEVINDMQTIGMTMQQVQINTKFLNALPPEWSKFVTDVKLAMSLYTTNSDQLYAYLSQHERHAEEARILRERYLDHIALEQGDPLQLKEEIMQLVRQGLLGVITVRVKGIWQAQESGQVLDKGQLEFIADLGVADGQATQQTVIQNAAFQTDVLSEVPYSETYPNDMINQSVQEIPYSEQTPIDDYLDNEITSDSNIIPYSQYLQESQDVGVQDTNSFAQQYMLVISMFEQMTNHVANLDKENQTNKMVNESLIIELERYKERVKFFEQRQNVDLSKRKKLIDSQMDEMIRNRNAKFTAFQQEIDTLKQTLSNQAQRIKPTLYDGSVISKKHDVIYVIDDEETLILEEESRSKMLEKQNDRISKEKKINISPIDYLKLNKLSEDFGKHFVPQKELSAEQAFWLTQSNPISEKSVKSHTPVRIEAPSELPKCLKLEAELVNKKNMIEKDVYNNLLKSHENIQKHCISLELAMQLNQGIFQIDKSCENQNALAFLEFCKINELNAQLQAKDTTICKLKEMIHSLRENAKSVENSDLKAQLQEKVFATTTLKNELRKLKGKNVSNTAVSKPLTTTLTPGMYKLDLDQLSPKLLDNREAHIDYIKYTQEQAAFLWEIVEQARSLNL
ncbi:hypothetical protein Tco_1475039 [Tanacetum coccineum]